MRWIWMSFFLVACVDRDMPEPDEGGLLFAENCVACHGASGRGDGPLATSLDPAPADLTTLFARGYDRTKILSIIDGYQRDGHTPMPEFGAVLEGDLVPVKLSDGSLSPVPRPLAALLFYLEDLQTEPPS